jgi:hypothetical protein
MCKAHVVRIGIFGATGPAGSALGARLASVGYDVVLGSRSEERAIAARDEIFDRWPGRELSIEAGPNAEAAGADLVVVATPWDSAAPTAHEYAEALAGKVVISMANALVRIGSEFQPLMPPRGSIAAHVQAAVPASHVVAALHHVPAKELGHLDVPVECDVLMCSDDPEASKTVAEIVAKIPGCRPLDAGGLSSATAIEALTAVLLQLNIRYRTRVAPKLTGIRT